MTTHTTITYGISALRVENGRDTDLLRYRAITNFRDIDDVCAEFRRDLGHRPDVRIDIQTHRH